MLANRRHRPLRTLLVSLLVALALVPAAGAGTHLILGVDDDSARWADVPMTLLPTYRELGVRAVRLTLQWRPGESALSQGDVVQLDREGIAAWGIRVVLVVDGAADAPPVDDAARGQYCGFVADALRRYPTVGDVVVWTEPNSSTFWRPQIGAPAAYEALLARCWDVLHAQQPGVNVIAASAPHQAPAAWFAGLGAALRASGRTTPIFDTVGHNAYPETSGEDPGARHTGDSLDEGDYDRLLDALHTAFTGTAQPLPGQDGVTIWYMEDGFQSRVTRARRLYSGVETDRYAVSEARQAALVGAAIRLAYCQPLVGAFFNFELRDETSLAGWQSGLLRADWSPKPSFYAFRDALVDVVHRHVTCK